MCKIKSCINLCARQNFADKLYARQKLAEIYMQDKILLEFICKTRSSRNLYARLNLAEIYMKDKILQKFYERQNFAETYMKHKILHTFLCKTKSCTLHMQD